MSRYNAPGDYHNSIGIKSQDAVFSKVNERKCCIALADGAGSRRNAYEGAEFSVRIICEYIFDNLDDLFSMETYQLKKTLADYIYSKLTELAHSNSTLAYTYASTLLCFAADEHRFLMFHIGDGAAFVQRKNSWNVLSFPNGLSADKTYLTTSADPKPFVICGEMNDIESVALISDGILTNIFYDNFVPKINCTEIQEILKQGASMPHTDDVSYIFCKIIRGKNDGTEKI